MGVSPEVSLPAVKDTSAMDLREPKNFARAISARQGIESGPPPFNQRMLAINAINDTNNASLAVRLAFTASFACRSAASVWRSSSCVAICSLDCRAASRSDCTFSLACLFLVRRFCLSMACRWMSSTSRDKKYSYLYPFSAASSVKFLRAIALIGDSLTQLDTSRTLRNIGRGNAAFSGSSSFIKGLGAVDRTKGKSGSCNGSSSLSYGSGRNGAFSRKKFVAVVSKVLGLFLAEPPNPRIWINTPNGKYLPDFWRCHEHISGIGKGYPACVEQLVDVRGEHQAVVPIQTLSIRALAPWLDVTRNKQIQVRHAGDTASWLDLYNVSSVQALSDPGLIDPFNLSSVDPTLLDDVSIDQRDGVFVLQPGDFQQLQSERVAQCREICQISATILSQRRMSAGKQLCNFTPMIFGGKGALKRLPLDRYTPPLIVPARVAVQRKGLGSVISRDADCLNLLSGVGEDDISLAYARDVCPRFPGGPIAGGLRTPNVPAFNLVAVHLVVAYPPVLRCLCLEDGIRAHRSAAPTVKRRLVESCQMLVNG